MARRLTVGHGIWTSPMIAWVIEEEFGVQYYPGHVRKLLYAWGFSVNVHAAS